MHVRLAYLRFDSITIGVFAAVGPSFALAVNEYYDRFGPFVFLKDYKCSLM